MTRSQIHLVAWALVMVVRIAHGHIAERGVKRGPNDPLRLCRLVDCAAASYR